MITISNFVEKAKDGTVYMYIEGDGLSTDTLPTTYANKPIFNGSNIFLMDTCKVAFYNQTTGAWLIHGNS